MDPLARKVTCKILELMDEGVLDPKFVAEAAIRYMSEDDVRDFAHDNELFLGIDTEEEDEDDDYDPIDDFNYVGSRHHY